MLVALGKNKPDLITVDAVTRQIHECVVWKELRGPHEVHDFDIDFFFVVLGLLGKFPSTT
jgi:hypothetical protein